MNLFEIIFFVLALALSILLGKYFVRQIGWWGALPAPILGFGLVYALLKLLHKLSDLYGPNRPNDSQESRQVEKSPAQTGIDRNEKPD
jgi:hypothetical protein